MKLLEISIVTRNVPALSEFYSLILSKDFDSSRGKEKRSEIHFGEFTLSIIDNGKPPKEKEERVILQFEVKNVDEEYERLKNLGITITEVPTTYPWGWRAMGIEDPEGNHIDFVCKMKRGI